MTSKERAARRLDYALEEQARLSDIYQRSIGTSSEMSSYVRLQAAALDVSNRDRVVRLQGAARR